MFQLLSVAFVAGLVGFQVGKASAWLGFRYRLGKLRKKMRVTGKLRLVA